MRYSYKYPDIKKVSNWLFTISANLGKNRTGEDASVGIHFPFLRLKIGKMEWHSNPFLSSPQPDTQIGKEQIELIVRKSINKLPQNSSSSSSRHMRMFL